MNKEEDAKSLDYLKSMIDNFFRSAEEVIAEYQKSDLARVMDSYLKAKTPPQASEPAPAERHLITEIGFIYEIPNGPSKFDRFAMIDPGDEDTPEEAPEFRYYAHFENEGDYIHDDGTVYEWPDREQPQTTTAKTNFCWDNIKG